MTTQGSAPRTALNTNATLMDGETVDFLPVNTPTGIQTYTPIVEGEGRWRVKAEAT